MSPTPTSGETPAPGWVTPGDTDPLLAETVELTARRDPLALVLALARTAAQVVSAIALVVIAADIV